MGRSIYCSTCKREKEPGRDNESRCKSCKSAANIKKRALKRQAKGLEPFGSGRSPYCYRCKEIKETRSEGYCLKCRRERDNEHRLKTGQTKKHQTGLCPCGKERASYSRSYCLECLAKRAKDRYKKHPLTEQQIARRNELQRARWLKKHGERVLSKDIRHEIERKKYHGLSPSEISNRLKHQVRALTRAYIKAGKLIKQPCEVCKNEKVEAHHDDYNKPMDIRWLCKKHHVEHHMIEKYMAIRELRIKKNVLD